MTQYIPGKAKLLYDLALHFWAYTQTESWTAQKSLKNWQICYITIKEICATKEITPEKKDSLEDGKKQDRANRCHTSMKISFSSLENTTVGYKVKQKNAQTLMR